MRELVWLDSAVNDLARPSIGKPVTDIPDYRDLFIRFGAGGYVLRYRVHLDIVYAVYLRHYRELDFKI